MTPESLQSCRLRCLLPLAASLLAVASAAAANLDVAVRPAHELPVELLRPMPGEVLVGGREATVAWRPLRELEALGIDEWEAFLSYDGGRHWPVRITPHLDVEVSTFRFVVPHIPSGDVRLMLRFGDERREAGYVMPMSLRSVVLQGSWTPPPEPAGAPGEAARPGVPGVVLWVEGDRAGRELSLRTAGWSSRSLRASADARLPIWTFLAPPERRGLDWAIDRAQACLPVLPARRASLSGDAPVRAVLLLLLLCRLNE
jgi:hypothetical protein